VREKYLLLPHALHRKIAQRNKSYTAAERLNEQPNIILLMIIVGLVNTAVIEK
jgi:hypothetical protein